METVDGEKHEEKRVRPIFDKSEGGWTPRIIRGPQDFTKEEWESLAPTERKVVCMIYPPGVEDGLEFWNMAFPEETDKERRLKAQEYFLQEIFYAFSALLKSGKECLRVYAKSVRQELLLALQKMDPPSDRYEVLFEHVTSRLAGVYAPPMDLVGCPNLRKELLRTRRGMGGVFGDGRREAPMMALRRLGYIATEAEANGQPRVEIMTGNAMACLTEKGVRAILPEELKARGKKGKL